MTMEEQYRALIASSAMNGLLAQRDLGASPKFISAMAVAHADALIAELAKLPTKEDPDERA